MRAYKQKPKKNSLHFAVRARVCVCVGLGGCCDKLQIHSYYDDDDDE